MRIATWNINGMRARQEFILHWLRARKPDLVGLQELKMQDDSFPQALFEAEGYQVLTHGQKSWNGVAILSRLPAELVDRGLPGQEAFGARLISARVGGLTFTTVYCPNGKSLDHEDYPKKLAWYEDLQAHLAGQDGDRIVCGDFNVCAAPIDSWAGESSVGQLFHTDAERAALNKLLELGLTDVFRARHPELQKFSWWDYRGGSFHRKQGLRIDLLLASSGVLERVEQIEHDRDYRKKKEGLTASDHAPVYIDLAD